MPTPPFPGKSRSLIYGVWAWGTVLLVSVIAGWSILEEPALWMLAVSTGWNTFGAAAGFLARSNVPDV